MFNDLSSPAAFLATRRSGKPRDMVVPGPDADQLRAILTAAMRVPDHGKLAPWRIVEVRDRDAFAALLQRAFRTARGAPEREDAAAIDQFARQAPALLAILSTPVQPSKIPLWEQQLSAGALCLNLVAAATAHGFVASWVTGWAAYDAQVLQALSGGGGEHDRVAGFVFIGTAARDLEERPRPDHAQVVRAWP